MPITNKEISRGTKTAEQGVKRSEYSTDKMQKSIFDILRHRMSDNQKAVKSPVMKKNSQDWKSVEKKNGHSKL